MSLDVINMRMNNSGDGIMNGGEYYNPNQFNNLNSNHNSPTMSPVSKGKRNSLQHQIQK